MVAQPNNTPASTLLVDESFAKERDDFVELLRGVNSPTYLSSLADRWKRDPRPWTRLQVLKYLESPLDRPGHQPIVKRLFKHFEAQRDDEVMAGFLVAFDRLVRRRRRVQRTWNAAARQIVEIEELFAPRDQILAKKINGKWHTPSMPKGGRLFSYATRAYIRRRAWRYFRRRGFQQPAQYVAAIARSLTLYRDDDVASGENILDNWSLLQIAFGRSVALQFTPTRATLADGRSMSDLTAAPRFEKLWRAPEAATTLLKLVEQARSRLVRVWAIQLLKRDHAAALKSLTAEALVALLDHPDQDVAQFGASILDSADAVDSWPIETWLRLLQTRSATALATVCEVMSRRVSPERLSLAQCVELTCARPTPVAKLGLAWLAQREARTDGDREIIARLAGAKCEAVGKEIGQLAISICGTQTHYRVESIVALFDSLNSEVRAACWDWLVPGSSGYHDPALWSRLLESPFDDVRIRLVRELDGRAGKDGPAVLARQDLTPVWVSVLLSIHRGGRAKLRALRQIAEAMARQPERAATLIPVLTIAIRSVRGAEARAGLAALLAAVTAHPELESQLTNAIPELRLTLVGTGVPA